MTTLTGLDIAILIGYFGIVTLIGWFVSRNLKSGDDLFLAGRSLGVATIGFSLFASNISSTTLIGVTGQAYSNGISVANYELMAGFLMAFMVFTTIPLFLRLRITTVPEYLGRRFGPVCRKYFSALTIFLTVFVDMAASVYAGVIVLQTFFPSAPFIPLCVGLAVFAGLYTAAGGLRAVVYTDVLQAIILLIGAGAIAFMVFGQFDFSWARATEQLPDGHMSLIRPMDDPALPWLGLMIGVPVLGWFYWSNNQYVVQRVLAAKNIETGRKGAIFAGLLKILPLLVMAIPGAMAAELLPGLEDIDLVFPTLVAEYLPMGFTGIVLAGLIAAIMSTVDSTLNSASTLILHDFVDVKKRNWDEKKIMMLGRLSTAGLIIIAALWPLAIREFPGVFEYIQQVFGYAAPPIVAIFLLGIFWKKTSGRAAVATLISGHLIGAATFAYRAYCAAQGLDDGLPHFTIMAGLTTALCLLLCVIFSFTLERVIKHDPELVLMDSDFKPASPTATGWRDFRLQAVLLVLVTVLTMIIFW